MLRLTQFESVVSKPAISELGSILLGGIVRNSPGAGRERLRIYGSYALVYLFEGSGLYRDAGGTHRLLTSGDLIWIFPDLGHEYGPGPAEAWSEFFITFQGPLFDLWRQTALLSEKSPVEHLAPTDYWLERFVTFGRQLADRNLSGLQVISRLQQLVTDIFDYRADRAAPLEPWIRRIVADLQHPSSTPPDFQALARNSGISYETFRKRFKERLGVSPGAYAQRCRIQAACELLVDRKLTVKEVAGKLGFASEFHFSRVFKKLTGRAPSALIRK